MGRTRLSVLLAQLVLGIAVAVPAFQVAHSELSAAKRLGLRFSEPLTRRSPNTGFMRFGRSGGGGSGDGDGDGDGGRPAAGDVASKVHVKREAYGSAATDASASASASASLPSLTCVPDADTKGRVLCYTPFNVSRHFVLVTERASHGNGNGHDHRPTDDQPQDETDEGENEDDVEEEEEKRTDDDDDGDDDDNQVETYVGYENDDDGDGDEEEADDAGDGITDVGPVDGSQNDGRNQTARHSRVRGSTKQRFGRSTASLAKLNDHFARFSRRRDNFMRLGRAGIKKNESPVEPDGKPDLETDYAAILAGHKRGSQNFIRFGRDLYRAYRPYSGDGREVSPQAIIATSAAEAAAPAQPASESDQQTRKNEWSEVRRQQDGFERLGRHGPGDMNQLRFGRSSDRIGARVAPRHGSFMRLGRSGSGGGGGGGGHFDLDMFRETRRRDSFLRLGRATSRAPSWPGHSLEHDRDRNRDRDVYRIAMATAALEPPNNA